MINNYQKELLESTDLFNTLGWPIEVKEKAKENPNITGEQVEETYKELCKALVKNKKGIILSFNEQPDEVQEKVWEMLKFLFE